MTANPKKHHRLGYVPIGYKLLSAFTIFIILLVVVNGYVTNSMYDTSMRKQTRINLQGTLAQIKDNVAYKANDMTRISSLLYDDYNLVQSLRSYDTGKDNYNRMVKTIIPLLEAAAKSIGFRQQVAIYVRNSTVSEVYPNQPYEIYHLKRILGEDWYEQYPKERYGVTMQWKQIENDEAAGKISLLRRIVDTTNPLQVEELGMMRFSVGLADLFGSVDSEKTGEGSGLLVQDSEGNTLYSSGRSGGGLESPDVPGSSYLTIEDRMEPQGWTIVAHVPMTVIGQEAKKVQSFLIGACVLCFLLFMVAGGFISRYFSLRITKFVAVLNAFREGDLHKRMTYKGKDEFSQIATALNGMGEEIEALINKVYLTQLQKKEAELEMLQLQINPHFLYNTLHSINRLAKFGENERLQQTVLELAKFYRLTLNSGRILIPVSSEIEQSKAYLAIQQIKYGSRLEVDFDVDTGVWPYETVKLILQPFIENALKHAWAGDRIHLRITATLEEEEIVYRIIDDGMGMKKTKLRDLLDPPEDGASANGYGIRNVDQRIKLQYGPEYGVRIFSRPGIGTTVQLRIPARKRKVYGALSEASASADRSA